MKTVSIWVPVLLMMMLAPATSWAGFDPGTGSSLSTGPKFKFHYDDGINVAVGSLHTSRLVGGDFLVTSGTLTVTAGEAVGTYTVFSGGPDPISSPSGNFVINNRINPTTDPVLDEYGLLFTDGTRELNIWGVGAGRYSFFTWDTVNGGRALTQDGLATVTVTTNPEPASLTLLGIGIVGLAGYGWGRRKPTNV